MPSPASARVLGADPRDLPESLAGMAVQVVSRAPKIRAKGRGTGENSGRQLSENVRRKDLWASRFIPGLEMGEATSESGLPERMEIRIEIQGPQEAG